MHGYTDDKDAYIKRMRRIEGQVRGIARMIESDKYCIDVLTQVSAATKALEAVALGLLDEHLKHCVTEAVAEGGAGRRRARSPRPARPSPAWSVPDPESARPPAGLPRRSTRRQMSTATYTVTGMTCEHCVASVTEEIGEIAGVSAVDVELASGAVTVTSAEPLDRRAVRAAVEEAGYELAG